MADRGRALVLGGGGITGIAWETGMLAGLADAGLDLTSADLFVGTSAGSVVGADIASGKDVAELYAAQVAEPRGEVAARFHILDLVRYVVASVWPGSDEAARARVGRMALAARTASETERRRVIVRRIGDPPWPSRRLLVTARRFPRAGGHHAPRGAV